eukprot:gene8876-9826_t
MADSSSEKLQDSNGDNARTSPEQQVVADQTENNQSPAANTVDPNKGKDKDAKKNKIDVLLKATGDAPIMKKKKWAVDRNKQVAYLIDFIRKYIKCNPSESLCFGSDGKLVLHYCKTEAWG